MAQRFLASIHPNNPDKQCWKRPAFMTEAGHNAQAEHQQHQNR